MKGKGFLKVLPSRSQTRRKVQFGTGPVLAWRRAPDRKHAWPDVLFVAVVEAVLLGGSLEGTQPRNTVSKKVAPPNP